MGNLQVEVAQAVGTGRGLVPEVRRPVHDGREANELRVFDGRWRPAGQLRWRWPAHNSAISLVLLVGVGLFLLSLQQAQSVDPGLGREPTALMTLRVPATRFAVDEARPTGGATPTRYDFGTRTPARRSLVQRSPALTPTRRDRKSVV